MTRRFWVVLHRCAGLTIATFIVVAGLTGCLLAFYHEINEWLNPGFYRVPVQAGEMMDSLDLRERGLSLLPESRINYVDLDRTPGKVWTGYFEPRVDAATREPAPLTFSSIVLNPYDGAVLERVRDGYWPLTRKNLMGFVYALHYSVAMGEFGVWLFGAAAVVWTLDCFVGLYLTLPRRVPAGAPRQPWPKRWLPAWKMVLRGQPYQIHFSLHRALGLWVWPVLLVFAWSAVAFNLRGQVYNPVMKGVFGLRNAVDDLPKLARPRPDPGLDWREAREIGRRLMREQSTLLDFRVRHEQGLSYDADKGLFHYVVQSDRDLHHHYGSTLVAFDANTGAFRGISLPTGDNAAQTFTTWICALHMAGVWGAPMQAVVCCMGLAVAVLPITGVSTWWKRRQTARKASAGLETSSQPG